MLSSESWFYQCACLSSSEDDTQLSADAAVAVVDENGQVIDVGESRKPQELNESSFLGQDEKEETKDDTTERKPDKTLTKKKSVLTVELKTLKAELKNGVPYKKHCSDGKIRKRTLVLSPDATRLAWKLGQKEDATIPLATVKEVREATAVDPDTVGLDPNHPEGMGGTETFRKTCDGIAVAKRAFSFILETRTLDVEVETELQAKRLVSGFRALVQKAKKKAEKAAADQA